MPITSKPDFEPVNFESRFGVAEVCDASRNPVFRMRDELTIHISRK